ncbi:MAG: guanylate kinase [Phycisphaeraceae bacterium]
MQSPGFLLIISGPSGVGKTTITHEVERALGAVFSVSLTTRPITPKDVEGRDYYFVDKPTFEARRDRGELLEWAEVFGNCYGTPRGPVQDTIAAGRIMILEIDVVGAIQIKARMPEAYALFVLPPSENELLRRLRSRKREDETVIQRRFAKAKSEIIQAWECSIYDDFIVNRDLDKAVAEAVDLVRQRRDR